LVEDDLNELVSTLQMVIEMIKRGEDSSFVDYDQEEALLQQFFVCW
jgi:hypothetical protein